MHRRLIHRGLRMMLATLAVAAPASSLAAADCAVTASSFSFGNYNPLDALPRDSTSTINVQCSLIGLLSLTVTYELSLSTGSSASYGLRTLVGPGDPLGYQLYADAARLLIWGDGTAGTVTITDGYLLGLGTVSRNYPVYGRLPAGQQVGAGTFTDSITVTLEF